MQNAPHPQFFILFVHIHNQSELASWKSSRFIVIVIVIAIVIAIFIAIVIEPYRWIGGDRGVIGEWRVLIFCGGGIRGTV